MLGSSRAPTVVGSSPNWPGTPHSAVPTRVAEDIAATYSDHRRPTWTADTSTIEVRPRNATDRLGNRAWATPQMPMSHVVTANHGRFGGVGRRRWIRYRARDVGR